MWFGNQITFIAFGKSNQIKSQIKSRFFKFWFDFKIFNFYWFDFIFKNIIFKSQIKFNSFCVLIWFDFPNAMNVIWFPNHIHCILFLNNKKIYNYFTQDLLNLGTFSLVWIFSLYIPQDLLNLSTFSPDRNRTYALSSVGNYLLLTLATELRGPIV